MNGLQLAERHAVLYSGSRFGGASEWTESDRSKVRSVQRVTGTVLVVETDVVSLLVIEPALPTNLFDNGGRKQSDTLGIQVHRRFRVHQRFDFQSSLTYESRQRQEIVAGFSTMVAEGLRDPVEVELIAISVHHALLHLVVQRRPVHAFNEQKVDVAGAR